MRLYVDVETYSDVDLGDCGVHVYTASPSFRLLSLAYAIDDEPTQVVDCSNSQIMPFEFTKAVNRADEIIAHNAPFEISALASAGITLNSNKVVCTMVLAKSMGYPASLENLANYLGCTPKDYEGKRLIRLFSMPNRQGKRVTATQKPDDWQKLLAYNRQDVDTTREIYLKLLPRVQKPSATEWRTHNSIDRRGVMLDVSFIRRANDFSQRAHSKAIQRLSALCGIDCPTDAQLRQKFGVESLNKKEVANLVHDRPELRDILELRAQTSKTSVAKYAAMLNAVGKGNRARGLLQFYGAGRTGRWAGRLIQVQNLPRISMSLKELATARKAVMECDFETFSMLYPDKELSVLSQLVRTAFIPCPGAKFVIADFSSIEARILAWYADEKWRLDVFAGDGKIYESSAERMFNLPKGSVTKDSPYRQKGKIAELALGYGGAVGALTNMGALEMGLTKQELPILVNQWRKANRQIVNFWANVNDTLHQTILGARRDVLPHGLYTAQNYGDVQVILPNGRALTYAKAVQHSLDGSMWYESTSNTTGVMGSVELYGAKCVENIVQATARDCLADTLTVAEERGWNPVFHVHDEIICEVREDLAEIVLEELLKQMSRSPQWAPGMPLKADGFVADYYCK